ncbi:MAG: toprim domain-containing protein, partial [Proteobacteria bacterium]|nr:toprim domain-containing protein [Pseudomonadota bacterium]
MKNKCSAASAGDQTPAYRNCHRNPKAAMTPSDIDRPAALHVLGALALELKGGAAVARAALSQAQVGELGALVARDLATFSAEAAALELVTVGAHYDPVEMLRPGWPLHRELDQLAARAPGDARSRVIAFGGRILGEGEPKYLNSPDTPLFDKGRTLYNLDRAGPASRQAKRLIVVEGYMDVVALFEHGFDTAVATLGTATTPEHAELLFRNAADVYFCFDGDRAGRSAAWKAVESVLPRMRDGRQAFFLFLPEGEDPDTIVRKEGAAGFDARLREATPLSQFLFDSLDADVNLGTLDGKARLAERAKPLLAQIPDGAFADLMRQRLSELTGLGEHPGSPHTRVPAPRPHGGGGVATPKRSLVRGAISLLLQQPALALELQPPFRFAGLRQPGVALLLELLQLVDERPDIGTGSLIEHFDGREEYAALQKLASQSLPGDEASWRHEFVDVAMQL